MNASKPWGRNVIFGPLVINCNGIDGSKGRKAMGSFSVWHWAIVLVIVMLVFGTKKLANIGTDLGTAIKGFREGVRENDDGPGRGAARRGGGRAAAGGGGGGGAGAAGGGAGGGGGRRGARRG